MSAGEPRKITTDSGDQVEAVFVTGSGVQEPVRPVWEYCKAFEHWFQAIAQMKRDRPKQFEQDETWERALDAYMALGIAVRKSNLLYRLIYLGERLRTEPCPEHKGRWSGYGWGRICACQDYEHGGFGPDLTGWLPRRDGAAPVNQEQEGPVGGRPDKEHR